MDLLFYMTFFYKAKKCDICHTTETLVWECQLIIRQIVISEYRDLLIVNKYTLT